MAQPKKNEVKKGPAWRAAEAFGLDMSLVEANLELTPAERIHFQSRLMKFDQSLQRAMEASRGRS